MRRANALNVFRRFARTLLPNPLKAAIKHHLDERKKFRLFGELAPLVPNEEDMFDGTASIEVFHANGEEFLGIYTSLCALHRSGERMLDVGSGIGRKTIPLTRYFEKGTLYEGIDICAKGVDWCSSRISTRFPNFRFTYADVFNSLYNPGGSLQPSQFRFPFGDGSFTFVMLGSVFTHMLPHDVEHYVAEVARVLEPGQRCLASYFLLNDESRTLMKSQAASLSFIEADESYSTTAPELPERAIALNEGYVRALYDGAGLEIERVDYGSWCGRTQYRSYQDLVLVRKQDTGIH